MNASLSSLLAALAAPPPPSGCADDPPSQRHRAGARGRARNRRRPLPAGDSLYTLILARNHWFNRAGARLGSGYWSLSQYRKHKAKGAVSFITDFESALVHEARRRGFDGVVCGHIPKAEIHMVDGMLYCNDGDWAESLTALVEWKEIRLHAPALGAVTP